MDGTVGSESSWRTMRRLGQCKGPGQVEQEMMDVVLLQPHKSPSEIRKGGGERWRERDRRGEGEKERERKRGRGIQRLE